MKSIGWKSNNNISSFHRCYSYFLLFLYNSGNKANQIILVIGENIGKLLNFTSGISHISLPAAIFHTLFHVPDIFKLGTGTGNIVIKKNRFCSHGIHIIDTDSYTIITYRVKSRHFRSQQQFSTYRISS